MPEALDYLSHITVFYVDTTCVCLHLESISLKHFIFWMLCLTVMCSFLGVCGFHWSFILMFYAYSYLMWSDFLYTFLIFECCHFQHIMVMVNCLIDSYFWICISLCSIALSPLCCTCLIVHFSIVGGFVWVYPVLSLYLCIKISGLHSYSHLIMLIFILCGAVFGSMLWAYSLADVSSIL